MTERDQNNLNVKSSLKHPLYFSNILQSRVKWFYPFILAFISTALIFGLKIFVQVPLYMDSGLFSKILAFIQTLPEYYITIFTAIAPFNKVDIQRSCSMLTFVMAENLILIVLVIFAQSLYIPIRAVIFDSLHIWISGMFVLIFFLFFWQMIIVYFSGIFLLGDRVFQINT